MPLPDRSSVSQLEDPAEIDLSIVIVNYNGAQVLEPCLRSLDAGAGGLCYEIWVVDNGSNDGSPEMVRVSYPHIRLITNGENYGFARANNQALAQARGRYRLLLNNDTIVQPGALEVMVAAMEKHTELGALGPRLLNRDGTIQPSCLRFPSLVGNLVNFYKARRNESGKFVPAEREGVSRVDVVTGACLLLRGKTLDTIGLLDDGFFMYAEEIDWCYRAARAGWEIGYLPAAEVIHLGGQTAQREADRFYVERRYSRTRYYLKHQGRSAAAIDAALSSGNLAVRWFANPGDRARTISLLRAYAGRALPLLAGARPCSGPAREAASISHQARIVQMTSVHTPFDNRIFHKQCKSLAAAGYAVSLIAPYPRDEIIDGVQVLGISRSPNRWIRMVRAWQQIYARALEANGDLYHFHDPELLPVGVILRLRTRKPVVYDIHEDYVASIRQRRHWPRWFSAILAQGTAVIEPLLAIFCTQVLAERYYTRRFPAGHTILNYPSLDPFAFERRVPAPGQAARLIYTGTVSHDRGALLYAQMVALDPAIEIDVIGRCPPALEAEMKKIAGAGADRLHLLGGAEGVPFARIVDAYRSGAYVAGLAVFPPTPHYMDKELTKFYEYMAAGLPIVYSGFPTWRSLLETEQAGIHVDPGDLQSVLRAVRTLQESPELAEWMGQNGRNAVSSRYHWAHEVQKLIALYETLLCSGPDAHMRRPGAPLPPA